MEYKKREEGGERGGEYLDELFDCVFQDKSLVMNLIVGVPRIQLRLPL